MDRRTALVIEDDPAIANLIKYVLAAQGYVVTATDSAVGAAALTRRLRPDVILLDLGLPYRSGASLLSELKADPTTENIPIVVVSALAAVLAPERAAQADAVVAKPFSPQALLDVVAAVSGRVD